MLRAMRDAGDLGLCSRLISSDAARTANDGLAGSGAGEWRADGVALFIDSEQAGASNDACCHRDGFYAILAIKGWRIS